MGAGRGTTAEESNDPPEIPDRRKTSDVLSLPSGIRPNNGHNNILYFHFTFYIVPMGLLPWEIQVAFPWESQLRQSRYPT